MFSHPYDLFEIAKHSYRVHLKFLQTSSVYYQYCQKHKELIHDHFQKVIVLDDRVEYRIDGELHRENDLPAVIHNNGTREWYRYGQLYREDHNMPVIVRAHGGYEWYKDGQRHRDGDLPAVIYDDGGLEWYKNGNLHRGYDRPAIIHGGTLKWYIHGVELTMTMPPILHY